MSNPVLIRLLEERKSQVEFIDQTLSRVETEKRDLVDAERSNLDAARQRITALDEQIKPLAEFEELRATSARITPAPESNPSQGERAPLGVKAREVEYRTVGAFLVDVLRAKGGPRGEFHQDRDAAQRVSVALGRDVTHENRAVEKELTSDVPGLLPKNIVGQILTDLDSTRPFIASVGAKDFQGIPGKTFERPHVTQHTLVGEQTAEKTELPSRKLKIEGIPFTKRTFGGTLNVSRQAIDWTSPSAWDAVVTDLQLEYGAETEDVASTEFAAAVTQTVTVPTANAGDIKSWITALYNAAVMAATANGARRATALRLPDTIWTSVDMWGQLGALITSTRTLITNSGSGEVTAFSGDILNVNRVMSPGLPEGTMIIGRKGLFEFYEERIGILSAVEPSILGIEVAYGGYAAWGALDPTAFVKLAVA